MQIELDEVSKAQLDEEYAKLAHLFIARLDPRDESIIEDALSTLLRDNAIPDDLRAYYSADAKPNP
jgi:hypothetical protein